MINTIPDYVVNKIKNKFEVEGIIVTAIRADRENNSFLVSVKLDNEKETYMYNPEENLYEKSN